MGYDILMYLVAVKMTFPETYNIRKVSIHTSNPPARDRMLGVIERYLS